VAVYLDDAGVGEAVAGALEEAGRRVYRVTQGTAYAKDGDRFTVRASSAPDHVRVFAAFEAEGGMPERVIFAWGVTQRGRVAPLAEVKEAGFHGLLAFAQALATEDPEANFSLDVMTSSLQRIGGEEEVEPAKALLLGPARVIPREFPNVRSRTIDLVVPASPARLVNLAALLAAEVVSDPADESVAFRSNDRYVSSG
jgi:hypothetical protein